MFSGVFVGELGLEILDVGIFSADVIQRFLDAFRLGAGDDGEILQLFEGGVVVLLGQIELFVADRRVCFCSAAFAGSVRGGEVVTVLKVSGQLGICGG